MELQWKILVNEALMILPHIILYVGVIMVILFTILIVSIILTIIIRIAEKNIIKKYLPSIERSEIQRLTLENKKLKIEKADLLARIKVYMETYSGVKFLLRKVEAE